MKKIMLALLLIVATISATFATDDWYTATTSCGTVYQFNTSQNLNDVAAALSVLDEIDCG